jgi:hypothetical protein
VFPSLEFGTALRKWWSKSVYTVNKPILGYFLHIPQNGLHLILNIRQKKTYTHTDCWQLCVVASTAGSWRLNGTGAKTMKAGKQTNNGTRSTTRWTINDTDDWMLLRAVPPANTARATYNLQTSTLPAKRTCFRVLCLLTMLSHRVELNYDGI